MRPHVTPRLAARGGQAGAGSRAQPSSPKTPAVTEPLGGKAQERIHVQLLPRFKAPPGGASFLKRKAEPSAVPAGPPRPPPCPLAGASAPPAFTRPAPAPRPPRTRCAGAGAAGSTSTLPAAAHAAGSTPGVLTAPLERALRRPPGLQPRGPPQKPLLLFLLGAYHQGAYAFSLPASPYCLSLSTLEHNPMRTEMFYFVSLLYS